MEYETLQEVRVMELEQFPLARMYISKGQAILAAAVLPWLVLLCLVLFVRSMFS